MKVGKYDGRSVLLLGKPRYVAGGWCQDVAWADNNTSQTLEDGSVHPAHRMGFRFTVAASSLNDD